LSHAKVSNGKLQCNAETGCVNMPLASQVAALAILTYF